MSGSHLRGSRWNLLATLAIGTSLALASSSKAQDLDNFRQTEAVKAQKTLSEIRNLIATARKLESKNPDEAKAIVLDARRQLANDTNLSRSDRSDLERQIRTALQSIEAAIREQGVQARTAADRDAQKQVQREKRNALEEKRKQAIGFDKNNDLIKTANQILATNERLKLQREGAVVAIRREEMESFSQLTEKRFTERYNWRLKYGLGGTKLTAKEKELIKMLNSTLSVAWDKTPLKDALEYLQDKTKQNILVDENSLKEANVEYDDPVTLKVKKLPVRMILKKILADKGLTYIIKDATIHVMTPEKARGYMVTRAYPIGDLLPVYMSQLPPGFNMLRQAQGVQQLVDLIVSTVDPPSWAVNGGTGTIGFHPPSMSLIIRQSAEFHYQMGGALSR